jgi:hypothetical protein
MTKEERELELALKELAEAQADLARIERGETKRGRPRGSKKDKAETAAKPKPAKRKRARRRTGHGYWPADCTIKPRGELVKVLPVNLTGMPHHPVTPWTDPVDGRHECPSCNGEKLEQLRRQDRIETIAALVRRGASLDDAIRVTS